MTAMAKDLSDDGIDELCVISAIAFCSSVHWLELVQTMRLAFENGRTEDYFVGDKPGLRRLIEQAARTRGLEICRS